MTKHVTVAGWEDVPHLSEQAKEGLLASYSPHERDARTKGIPQLGSGAIYPVPEAEILVEPFQLPAWYRLAYGMDVGWNRTAAVWGAHDLESDVIYLVAEHYRGQAEPPIHAEAIKSRGNWIPGVIDPAARGRAQADGEQLLTIYQGLGLEISLADNAVESGIYEVWSRLSTGRLKVFSSLQNWLSEFRLYRRDEKGKIVKERDHLMDATRYLIKSGVERFAQRPVEEARQRLATASGQPLHQSAYDPMAAMYGAAAKAGRPGQREPWMPFRGQR